MIETVKTDLAKWDVQSGDDPTFLNVATRIVAATAVLAQQRHIVVVRIDDWFGVRWLGFPKRQFRHRRRPGGLWTTKKLRDPSWYIPPFHPHRVLSEARFELSGDGTVAGPFVPSQLLHQMYAMGVGGERSIATTCEAGVYAWCSGNMNDRVALMVYIHTADGTSGWYAEFRKVEHWCLSRRTAIGDADWRRLLEIGGIRVDGNANRWLVET
ncbi:MAG: hypothetical protein IT450_10240 [Phycisphaerales bacterium]|nr:hypothetical protein [Phycisphaerales bacterium]